VLAEAELELSAGGAQHVSVAVAREHPGVDRGHGALRAHVESQVAVVLRLAGTVDVEVVAFVVPSEGVGPPAPRRLKEPRSPQLRPGIGRLPVGRPSLATGDAVLAVPEVERRVGRCPGARLPKHQIEALDPFAAAAEDAQRVEGVTVAKEHRAVEPRERDEGERVPCPILDQRQLRPVELAIRHLHREHGDGS
jgi:hypothetical protein